MSEEPKFKPKQVRRLSDYFSILQSGGKLDGDQRRDLRKLESKLDSGPSLGKVVVGGAAVALVAWGLYELFKTPKQPNTQA